MFASVPKGDAIFMKVHSIFVILLVMLHNETYIVHYDSEINIESILMLVCSYQTLV